MRHIIKHLEAQESAPPLTEDRVRQIWHEEMARMHRTGFVPPSPLTPLGFDATPGPASPLTEERVREIVREEIAKANEEEQSTFDDMLAKMRGRGPEPPPAPPEPSAASSTTSFTPLGGVPRFSDYAPQIHLDREERVLVERSIHDKLDRILAWIDAQDGGNWRWGGDA